MEETKNGRVMLEVYMTNGKLMYQEADEEYSRWVCRYSDEPQEDLTSEADWFVNVCDLQRFLSQPDDTIIKSDHLAYTGASYRVSEIQTFVAVATYEGAVALFKRGEDGKFVCSQTYASGINVSQCFWETLYPDAYERAIAKVRDNFFSDEVPFWYFVGKKSRDLYRVTPEAVYPCSESIDEDGESLTCRDGIGDGLNPEFFRNGNAELNCEHFDLEALAGTDYPQQKLETPESLLAIAEQFCDVEWQLREGYYGVLTDDEYYCARRELSRHSA